MRHYSSSVGLPAFRTRAIGVGLILMLCISVGNVQEFVTNISPAIPAAEAFTINASSFNGKTAPIPQCPGVGGVCNPGAGWVGNGSQPAVLALSGLTPGTLLSGLVSGTIGRGGGHHPTCRDGEYSVDSSMPKLIAIGQFTDNTNTVVASPGGGVNNTSAIWLSDFENGVIVPANATKLYVSFPDSDYSDNSGTCSLVVNANPFGYLDWATCDSIGGWAYDPDAGPNPIDVAFYVANPGGPQQPLTSLTASNPRPDLLAYLGSANHGYHLDTPASLKDGQPHEIWTYGLNQGNGSVNTKLIGSPKTIQCAPAPALSIQKIAGITTVARGGVIPYTMSITNSGNADALSVFFTDPLPSLANGTVALDLTESSVLCSNQAGTVVCALGTIYAGQTFTFPLALTAGSIADNCVQGTSAGVINIASATSGNAPPPSPATAATVSVVCQNGNTTLTLQKTSGQSDVMRGGRAQYSILVNNTGTAAAQNVFVTDPIPAIANGTVKFSYTGSSVLCSDPAPPGGNIVCAVGSIPAGQTKTLPIGLIMGSDLDGCAVNSTVNVTNANVTATASNAANPPAANAPAVTVHCQSGTPALGILKNTYQTVTSRGNNVQFTVSVWNTGNAPATNVIVTDDIPSLANGTVTFNVPGSSGTCSNGGGTISCSLGDINPGQNRQVTITFTAGAADDACNGAAANMVNTAHATADTLGDVQSSKTVSVQCPAPVTHLSLADQALQSTVTEGGIASYKITVTNIGTAPVTGIVMTDIPPTISTGNVTFNPAFSTFPASACTTDFSGNVVCQFGTINPGQNKQYTLAFTAGDISDSCTPNSNQVMTNSATITAPLPAPNQASANTTVHCPDQPTSGYFIDNLNYGPYICSWTSPASSSSSVASSSVSSSASSASSTSSSSSSGGSSSVSGGSSSSTSSATPPGAGADFFVYDISNDAAITYRGQLNTGFGIADVQAGLHSRAFAASPSASKQLLVINVTNPVSPQMDQAYTTGTATGGGLSVDTIEKLTLLGMKKLPNPSDGLATLWPGSDGTPTGTNYSQLLGAPVMATRLDPAGCFGFLSLSEQAEQLAIVKVNTPSQPSVVQWFNDSIGTRGTGVQYDPYTDHLFLVSDHALSVLGPAPGNGSCP